MGANCCVATTDKDDPQFEVSTYRNVRHSPSWSFRWDNRTHIEDFMDSSAHFSNHNGESIASEIKSGVDTETEVVSSEGSPPGVLRKFPIRTRTAGNSENCSADQSIGSYSSTEEKETIKSAGTTSASNANPSISLPSTLSSAVLNLDPSSSRSCSLSSDPTTSSRQAHCSPDYLLSRQVSDSRISPLKSLNENSSPEGRRSFVLSISGNDSSTGVSQGGSSDGWSMRTFTELVASSHRERWSFDREHLSSIKGNMARSHTVPSLSPHLQVCAVCSKLLRERALWSTQSELSVVAILVCGHVYHAECLESVTPEADRFEPPCPVCTNGEKYASKLLRKPELKARSKISRIAVADAEGDFDSISECRKEGVKGPRLGASYSLKSSFSHPFFRERFSIGSHPSRSVSESSKTRKKGLWARYRR